MIADSILEMNKARKLQKVKGMNAKDKADLYSHLTIIFWKSKYYLMHAASTNSLFGMLQKKKTMTSDDHLKITN